MSEENVLRFFTFACVPRCALPIYGILHVDKMKEVQDGTTVRGDQAQPSVGAERLTSLTVGEIAKLAEPFEHAFREHMARSTLEGKRRKNRSYVSYANTPLPTPEDRLLFNPQLPQREPDPDLPRPVVWHVARQNQSLDPRAVSGTSRSASCDGCRSGSQLCHGAEAFGGSHGAGE